MTGFIYFLRCGAFVKIGYSAKPGARMRTIATSTPYDLEILAVHPGTEEDEGRLHQYLAPHHHRREWFRWHEDIEQIIRFGIPHSDLAPRAVSNRPPFTAHIQRVCRILGSQNRLAEAMGCSQSKISWLLVTAKEISAEDALALDRATKGTEAEVSASTLRPDLWPTPDHVPGYRAPPLAPADTKAAVS